MIKACVLLNETFYSWQKMVKQFIIGDYSEPV